MILGMVFAILLLGRYLSKKKDADLLLVLLLLLMIYERTTYTVGFMGWYDTFKNTKINYYLWPIGLALGPLIYLYVRTTIRTPFRLTKKDLWHFAPVLTYFTYKMVLILHDMQQDDWNQGYAVGWKAAFDDTYVNAIQVFLTYSSQLLYGAFTVQLFVTYRKRVVSYFSNTYKVELNWIKVFLGVYVILFVYGTIADLIDVNVMDLDYIHYWWVNLANALAIVFLGFMAYRVDLARLHELTWDVTPAQEEIHPKQMAQYEKGLAKIEACIRSNEAHLNPDMNLKDLAHMTGYTTHEISEHINQGLGINFNEYINQYRVDAVKMALKDPEKSHLSLVAIAMDSGFNSKATFNRVFKKITGQSPSQYRSS